MARRYKPREVGLAALMLGPSLAVLGVFVIYPLIRSVFLAKQRCGAASRQCTDNGWDQIIDVFRSNEFQDALWVTVKFALITVPLGVALGVGLAVLADKQLRGIGFFRTVFSSTVATSVAVASLMWSFLLNPQVGFLADFLGGMFKSPGILLDPDTALWGISASSIWANLGFTFIVVTAALQGIPQELYESARVDGAGGWRRFTNVTVPMLGPTLLFVSVVLVSRAFQAFGEIDLLTDGGPQGSTTTITYLTYGDLSVIKSDDGLRAASAVLLFGLLLVVSIAQFRSVDKRIHYGN
jgi:sn-glycerol 3-phosphate transport system permease protein